MNLLSAIYQQYFFWSNVDNHDPYCAERCDDDDGQGGSYAHIPKSYIHRHGGQ